MYTEGFSLCLDTGLRRYGITTGIQPPNPTVVPAKAGGRSAALAIALNKVNVYLHRNVY
jgi:hypothetical protein